MVTPSHATPLHSCKYRWFRARAANNINASNREARNLVVGDDRPSPTDGHRWRPALMGTGQVACQRQITLFNKAMGVQSAPGRQGA